MKRVPLLNNPSMFKSLQNSWSRTCVILSRSNHDFSLTLLPMSRLSTGALFHKPYVIGIPVLLLYIILNPVFGTTDIKGRSLNLMVSFLLS